MSLGQGCASPSSGQSVLHAAETSEPLIARQKKNDRRISHGRRNFYSRMYRRANSRLAPDSRKTEPMKYTDARQTSASDAASGFSNALRRWSARSGSFSRTCCLKAVQSASAARQRSRGRRSRRTRTRQRARSKSFSCEPLDVEKPHLQQDGHENRFYLIAEPDEASR